MIEVETRERWYIVNAQKSSMTQMLLWSEGAYAILVCYVTINSVFVHVFKIKLTYSKMRVACITVTVTVYLYAKGNRERCTEVWRNVGHLSVGFKKKSRVVVVVVGGEQSLLVGEGGISSCRA